MINIFNWNIDFAQFSNDILEYIEEPKTLNKIIVGLDGMKVYTEKKRLII